MEIFKNIQKSFSMLPVNSELNIKTLYCLSKSRATGSGHIYTPFYFTKAQIEEKGYANTGKKHS